MNRQRDWCGFSAVALFVRYFSIRFPTTLQIKAAMLRLISSLIYRKDRTRASKIGKWKMRQKRSWKKWKKQGYVKYKTNNATAGRGSISTYPNFGMLGLGCIDANLGGNDNHGYFLFSRSLVRTTQLKFHRMFLCLLFLSASSWSLSAKKKRNPIRENEQLMGKSGSGRAKWNPPNTCNVHSA